MTRRLALPLLDAHRAALETCAYCPKLCRATCPVSNREPTEVLTPGGKMTSNWLAARGDIDVSARSVAVAWGCTGCFACRERCDHENPVVTTLYAARATWQEAGLAPAASARVVRQHALRRRKNSERLLAFAQGRRSSRTRVGLLLGCAYHARPDLCRDALDVTEALLGPVRLIDGCCGASLTQAGAPSQAHAERRSLRIAVDGCDTLVVLDPGCARELVAADFPCTTLVEVADARLSRFGRVAGLGDAMVRWHDACQLTRGLGLYEPPRRVLERALGRPADEFDRRREQAACSGAGGLLPLTMPHNSRAIVNDRLEEHERLGGGIVVTACASSYRHFAAAGSRVLDLVTVMNRSLDA